MLVNRVNGADNYQFRVPADIGPPTENQLIIGPSDPDGPQWGANSRYITRDGEPFMPVMGEFHFSRYPAGEWESALMKMKAGGVDIVSTYLFWIHHEEERGVFDFSGQRDIRRFLELCARHDLLVWLRLGPWSHGEVRNGGFPDWLGELFGVPEGTMTGWGKDDQLRTNDPQYLALVDQLWTRYADQCRGMMARDGGPVIGIQVENEYSKSGEGKGREHIARLLEMARAHGFETPFYSVTGWHNAPFPALQCLPMFGGYPAAPWTGSIENLPPQQVYRFDLERDAGGIGTDLKPAVDSQRDLTPYPLMTCEIGVGNQISDHRRPLVGTLDGVAPVFTRLGIGAACIGYYVFHGGTNPEGQLSTLQESKATGYPNDYPVKSYDFQAAIRESGRIDQKYHYLKKLHLFMHDFGAELAPTFPLLPDRGPEGNGDFGMVRMALRTDGRLGFLFVNNHVRGYPQAAHEEVQVRVHFGGREIRIPQEPATIPPGAMFVWPVAFPMEDALLLYSTAEPVCTLEDKAGKVFVFAQTITGEPEFVFDPETVRGPRSRFRVRPGCDSLLEIRTASGDAIRILTLTTEQALQAWKYEKASGRYLVLSDADLTFREDGIQVLTTATAPVQLRVLPELDLEGPGLQPEQRDGAFAVYSLRPGPVHAPQPVVHKTGDNEWSIRTGIPPRGSRLKIDFSGDVAELYLGDKLVYDWFYYGEPFEVSLDRYARELADSVLTLRIRPLDASKAVYLDVPRPGGEAVLKGVYLEVEQRVELTSKDR